ncbi:MAG: TonB-dependent receptor plug domain-containing protein [Phycisphaerales bacterium]|nr:TonB-dependent receptor plug domain-containing protein [Phycisphaerales bacterium]
METIHATRIDGTGARARAGRATAAALACWLAAGLPCAAQTDPPPEQAPTQPGESPPTVEPAGSEVDLLFEEFDVVVTAGRVAQPVARTGVPVSVLTAEDLHHSGVTSLPMILEFVPGVDVLQIDRNRFAIGVRGLHHEFSDRTLVLMNGQNVSSPVFGGVDFFRLPTFIEDIDRVEVVRGPGGAVWGANAFNGVINIINKSPMDTKGVLLSTTLNEFGDSYTHLRAGFGNETFAGRFSTEYDDQETSEDAIAHDDFSARDFSRSRRLAFDGLYRLSAATELTFGIAHSHTERGDFPWVTYQAFEDERLDYTRAYAKVSHEFSDDARAYIQWYGAFEDVNRPSMWRYGSVDNTLDAQLDFKAGEHHEWTLGANVRVVSIDADRDRIERSLADSLFNEQWAGAFVSDRWRAADGITIESQIRADWYSGTTWDWSGRVSALFDLDADAKHVLRLSGAKAFRAPQIALRELELHRQLLPDPPFPPDTYGVQLDPAGRLENEEIWSLEAGYSGHLADHLTVGVNSYVQWYKDLTGARLPDDPFGAGRTVVELDNLGNATAAGIEPELTLTGTRGRLSIWYALNQFDLSGTPDQNARAFLPAEHKLGARGRYAIVDGLTVNANYRYTSPTPGDNTGTDSVPESHRFDLNLTLDLPQRHGEIMLGVTDLFDDTRMAVESIGANDAAFETPGRTLFARLQLRF